MKSLKIVLMGTTDFAVPALDALVNAGHSIAAVVCQPDRPNARGRKTVFLPVKKRALELSIPILQPERIKDPEEIETLRALSADVFVVAAYGQILSEEVLNIPPLGAINIHGSLLPEYRGAAPIHHAIIDGKDKTGVTIMQMDAGMDTGDMLLKGEVPITETTTVGGLHDQLAKLGGELIVSALKGLAAGNITPEPQNDDAATYADKIDREIGHIDWTQSSFQVLRRINGTDPYPGSYGMIDGARYKLFKPEIVTTSGDEKPGTILTAENSNSIVIKTGDGGLAICEIQAPGKRRMAVDAYLAGNHLPMGTVFEE